MSRADNWARTTALKLGLGGVIDYTPARVGQTLHLPCKHGHLVDFFVKSRVPPEAISKMLLKEGWTTGHKLTCPEHSRKNPLKLVSSTEPPPKVDKHAGPLFGPRRRGPDKKPRVPLTATKAMLLEALTTFARPLTMQDLIDLTGQPKTSVQKMVKELRDAGTIEIASGHMHSRSDPARYTLPGKEPEPMPEAAATPIVPPAPPAIPAPPTAAQASEAARNAKRLAMIALEDLFVDGRYKTGASDEKIAKDCGISTVKVAEIREEFFGPIKEPNEIASARAELATLENRIATFERDAAKTVDEWRTLVSSHRQRLADLIKRNGWNT